MRKTLAWALGIVVVVVLIGAAFVGGVVTAGTLGWIGRRPATPAATVVPPTGLPGPVTTEPGGSATPVADRGAFDYQLLQDVLDLLKQEFYGEIPDAKTLAYGAIRGMLQTLDDPYTSFIEPKAAAILNEDASGQFEGIGATVRMRQDGYLEVVRPLPGHPAEAAGIKAGDLIIKVDDTNIVGLGLYEALSLIRGPAGTQVTLEVARPGQEDTFTVAITRARIEMPIVESKMLDNGIAYLQLTEFDANAANRVETELKALLRQKPKGLIFDLRDNPGGWLDQAIKVGDIFLPKGVVAIERDSSGGEQKFYSFNGDLGEDIPLVVLVNGGSASASEIVAGALQDRGRAVLIGEQTLGKGSVQRPHDLSDGAQLRVTIARWFTPNDHTIHGEGLKPDVEVLFPAETPAGEDPQLQRAIEYLLQGK